MGGFAMSLTVKIIEGLNKAGMYRDERTLFLKVSQSSKTDPSLVSKSWVQRIMTNKKRQDFGLGAFPIVSIGEARARAMENRIKAEKGISLNGRVNPTQESQAVTTEPKPMKKGVTFKELAFSVIQFRKQSWKKSNQAETIRAWENSLEQYAFPSIGEKLVKDITPQDVLNILKPYWFEKNEMMKLVKQRLGVIFQNAVTERLLTYNPAYGLEKTLVPPKTVEGEKGFKAIPHSEVANVIATIKGSNAMESSKLCFEFCILTASRPSEARLATWEEINLDEKVWTIPANRMKAGRFHMVPLSSRACAILKEAKGLPTSDGNLVFPGSSKGLPMGTSTISKLCMEHGIEGQPHAISRACFSTWCAEEGINSDVYEAALAHTVKGVKGAYQRSKLFDLRVPVMEQWGAYLTQ